MKRPACTAHGRTATPPIVTLQALPLTTTNGTTAQSVKPTPNPAQGRTVQCRGPPPQFVQRHQGVLSGLPQHRRRLIELNKEGGLTHQDVVPGGGGGGGVGVV